MMICRRVDARSVQDDILQFNLDLLTDLTVLSARGEIDLGNVHVLEEALAGLDKALPLLLDFTDVQYMDSTTIRVLFRTCDRFDRLHTPIALVSREAVRHICGMPRRHERLSLFADTSIARGYLAGDR